MAKAKTNEPKESVGEKPVEIGIKPELPSLNSGKPTSDEYPKLRRDLANDVAYFMKEIKAEIEWLDEHCGIQTSGCKSSFDLCEMAALRDYLRKTAEDLRQRNYDLMEPNGIVREILNGDQVSLLSTLSRI